MFDTLIRNALVFDGRGNPPQPLDVGIRDGLIVALAPHLTEQAQHTVDAAGRWLTPGFVDIHTHYDLEVEVAPGLAESVRHGVTTVLMGNCSLSIACGEPQDLADVFQRVETLPAELIQRWLTQAKRWHSLDEYLAHFEHLPLGPNVALLLGHSALRLAVMGLQRAVAGPATPAEITAMAELAEQGLALGFAGLSVDMVHWHKVHGAWAGRALPSHHADYAEYAALAEVCRRRDTVFQVTPNPERPQSLLNILRLGAGSWRRPPLRMTVLSALDMDTQPLLWRTYAPLLWLYNQVAGNNLRLQTLTEAFTIYSAGPITPLFEEFASGVELNNARSAAERRALWQTPGFRQRFAADWQRPGIKTFHREFARMQIADCPQPQYIGLSIAAAAARQGCAAIDWFMDQLASADEALVWVSSGANNRPAIRQRLMSHRHILPGFTDAGAHGRNLAYFDGALALLQQAVTSGFMTPQQAIARVTSEPAAWLNLDAGVLAVGRRADLLLLDPAALQAPRRPPVLCADAVLGGAERRVNRPQPSPVCAVWVGGQMLVADGEPLPALGHTRAGRLLRPKSPIFGLAAVKARYRNRIDDLNFDHGLTDYWEIFALKHQHPANIRLHAAAVWIMYGSAMLAALLANPWWLVGIPLSNVLGQWGHRRFEPSHVDGRDALFSWRAMAALTRLAWQVLRGTYGAELARIRAKWAAQ